MDRAYDAVVIGSGFGGALAALPLVHAGWRVLMLERGDWVERGPHNWRPESVTGLSPHYDHTTPYELKGDDSGEAYSIHCVGGPSLFYGAVSLRYRERDFIPTPEERLASALWPYSYDDLEPYYTAAEHVLGVAGATGQDPTEPHRSAPYAQRLPPLSRIGQRISDAAERIGCTPFRLPLAINYRNDATRAQCVGCSTCDCYPCAIAAKNDVASAILPGLRAAGLEIRSGMAARRIAVNGRRAYGVECVELSSLRREFIRAQHVIVAAGALATPHLLLASRMDQKHESGAYIGRMLMRHVNAIVFGVFAQRLDAAREFHKQIGINDFYFGHPAVTQVSGKLGIIQQIHSPPSGLVRSGLPRALGTLGSKVLGHMTGLIVIANDQPQYDNCVQLAPGVNALGMPSARIHHRYSRRDKAGRAALTRVARTLLKEAGALTTVTIPVRTFSHALGTVRMGNDPASSPLDECGRLRGFDNVLVTDASALPTSAAVNPSLTIAASALRAGCLLAGVNPPAPQRPFIRISTRKEHAHG